VHIADATRLDRLVVLVTWIHNDSRLLSMTQFT